MGQELLRAVAVFSNDGRNRGKCGLVLNRRPVMCTYRERGCRWSRIWGREAHSVDGTSLVQAVCRSSHGLRLGQVELLEHKIPEGVESVVHSQIFVR